MVYAYRYARKKPSNSPREMPEFLLPCICLMKPFHSPFYAKNISKHLIWGWNYRSKNLLISPVEENHQNKIKYRFNPLISENNLSNTAIKQFISFLKAPVKTAFVFTLTDKQINGIKVNKSLNMPYFCPIFNGVIGWISYMNSLLLKHQEFLDISLAIKSRKDMPH